MASKYMPQIVLACMFTSVSIHLLNQRRDSETEQRRHAAQIIALEDVLRRQRAGEPITDAELLKIRRRVGLILPDGKPAVSNAEPVRWQFIKPKESNENASDDQTFAEWQKGMPLLIHQVPA